MSRYVIETVAQLDSMPDHTVIIDRDEDVWQYRGGLWCSYETSKHGSEWIFKKYSPLRVIFTPDVEHIDPDCKNDKHPACPGWTFADDLDRHTPCECACHDPEEHQP